MSKSNYLCLEGKKQILNKILPEQNIFSFGSLVSPPPNNSCPRMSLNDPLSNWFVDNWGTKWDAINPIVETHKRNKIVLIFYTAWTLPDKWLEHIFSMFPELKFNLVWADEDFPSSGYICTKNNSVESAQFNHDDPKAREFVKMHFPDFYTKCLKEEQIFLITKISLELTKYFKCVKKTIGCFNKPISGLKVYSCSSNSFAIAVLKKCSFKSQTNIFYNLTPNGKKMLLIKTKELLKNEGLDCQIKKDVIVYG